MCLWEVGAPTNPCTHNSGDLCGALNQPILSRTGRVAQEEHMICIVVK